MTVRLGTWVRVGATAAGMVGLVAAVDGDAVAVFSPADRRVTRVPLGEVTELPAGGVAITASVTLPLPHGLDEGDARRWLAALSDPVLRERARAALAGAGLDVGAALAEVSLTLRESPQGTVVCAAGHDSAAVAATPPAGQAGSVACPVCDRAAYPPPRPPA